ncbi:MAG TPA: branched-chain amino acid ABC transporter substrate-binding protein [Gaiellaceae bacterium]|jgi:branched-chain amino acid transport system substrate-binding protein|nr:branched-chain amino acid ABC transporter substrate-binding protein [Gaiellaceae bacterium]
MKKFIGLAFAVAVASVAAGTASGGHRTTAAATSVSCSKTLKIAIVTPLTGGAAFLGQEQLSWAKLAINQLAPQLGLKIQLLQGDTPVEQGATPAQTLAQKYNADSSVVGIIGPSTSGAAAASSKAYFQAGMAHISPSATRTDLTYSVNGQKEGTPAFFRDVPADNVQGPTDAAFMVNTLHVKKVVIFDFQEPYSQGLASAVDSYLKGHNVSTVRLSAPNTTTDYSSYVTKVPGDADVVFFPTQQPPAAQTFAEQLVEQGKKAVVFGGDGSNAPSQFNKPGSYVSNFAPDITGIKADAGIIAAWKKANPGKQVGSFGPPTYGATQILLNAIKIACTKGHGTLKSRADVLHNMKKVQIKNWILGGSFKFSTKTNDPLNAKFYIFKIQSDGSYKLVG